MAQFFLKNSQPITLRGISRADAKVRHEFFCELSRAQSGMLHTIDEIDEDPEESFEQIDDFLRNQRGLWLVAENRAGHIIGELDITIKSLRRVRHVGTLTMGVAPHYQGLGLGSLLIEQACLWAQSQGLRRIELFTFATNLKAQKLYIKHGFIQEGVRKNYLRHDDGRFEDDFLFAKYI